jgi:selenocysteine-specific elongation factor
VRDRADGGRTALNVTGLPVEALRRGDVLTSGAGVLGSDRLLVELRSGARGPGTSKPPKRGARLRLHIGTDQVDAAVRQLPARPSAALLTLERPVATFAGDRAILREPSSSQVVAGLRVLDPSPPRGASRRRMNAERLELLAGALETGDSRAVAAARLQLHGALAAAPLDGEDRGPTGRGLSLAADVRASLEEAVLEAVVAHHREGPLSAGLPLPRARAALLRRLRSIATVERRDADESQLAIAALLDDLVDQGRLARVGDALRDPARGSELPSDLVAAMNRLEAALAVEAPPPLGAAADEAGCPPEGVRALQAGGRIVRLGPDLAWSTPTFHRLAALALERARVAPLTPAVYRDATGTTRRYVLAILEDLDRRGILQRTPEGHIPGPRAPRPEPVA